MSLPLDRRLSKGGSHRRRISFFRRLRLTEGSKRDWSAFARWHYRSHTLGPVKRVTLLWHGERRIGICVFCAPAAQLRLRNEFFGWSLVRRPLSVVKKRRRVPSLKQRTTDHGQRTFLKMLNRTLWVLSRVVLHPTYRGAGIASAFVRRSCASCPVPWIETLAAMGHVNPLFERAGFIRVGVIEKQGRRDARSHARIYGGGHELSAETVRKSLRARPVYYVFDNRRGARRRHANPTSDGLSIMPGASADLE
jgi:hypothetical protein